MRNLVMKKGNSIRWGRVCAYLEIVGGVDLKVVPVPGNDRGWVALEVNLNPKTENKTIRFDLCLVFLTNLKSM